MVLEQFVAFCLSWLIMLVLGLYTAPFHRQCDAIRGSELLVSLAVLLTWNTIYLSPGFHSCQYQPSLRSISQSNLGFVYLCPGQISIMSRIVRIKYNKHGIFRILYCRRNSRMPYTCPGSLSPSTEAANVLRPKHQVLVRVV